MMTYLKILASLMIVALFIYSKVQPYELKMFPNYQKTFATIKSFVKPLLSILGKFIKPFKIGNGLFIDATQFILLILLLLILLL